MVHILAEIVLALLLTLAILVLLAIIILVGWGLVSYLMERIEKRKNESRTDY